VTSKSEMKPKQGISRRTVVKGTAWAVPAVVVATAAPAMAAGASQCITASFDASSCKQPGTGQNNFGFKLKICFTNTCAAPVSITVTKIQGNAGSSPVQNINQTITVGVNATVCIPGTSATFPGFTVYCSANSANFINVFFTVNGGPEQMQSVASPPQDCATSPILCPK
jgi:hypothetical protein